MTIDELVKSCGAIDEIDGKPVSRIYLTIRIKRVPSGCTVGLCGRSGPRGRICSVKDAEGEGYNCTANFSAPAILAYIKKNNKGE
jgi:hypothetical protein